MQCTSHPHLHVCPTGIDHNRAMHLAWINYPGNIVTTRTTSATVPATTEASLHQMLHEYSVVDSRTLTADG